MLSLYAIGLSIMAVAVCFYLAHSLGYKRGYQAHVEEERWKQKEKLASIAADIEAGLLDEDGCLPFEEVDKIVRLVRKKGKKRSASMPSQSAGAIHD